MSDVGRVAAKTNLLPPSDIRLMEDWAQLDWQPLLTWIVGHVIIFQSLDKTDGLLCICDFLSAYRSCSSLGAEHIINFDSGHGKKSPPVKVPGLPSYYVYINHHNPHLKSDRRNEAK
jgi:hypothetical protein